MGATWTLEGLLDENSKYYQENFMKISNDNYHIVNNYKYSLKIFLKMFLIILYKVLNIPYLLNLIWQA